VKCVVAYAERIFAKKENSAEDIRKLRDISEFLMSKESHREASNILERLFKYTNDIHILGQLVISLSYTDTKLAEQYGDKLGAIRVEDDVDIDIESLENIAAPRLTVKASADTNNNNPQVKEKEKKKKKKKKILPKNLEKNIDPERWMPYKERSYYRKKKGKYGALEKGSQGVSEKKVAGKGNNATSTAAPAAAVPPVKQAAPQTQSKPSYKKKGRR